MVIRATPKPVVPLVPAQARPLALDEADTLRRGIPLDGAAAPALPESEPLEGTIEPMDLVKIEEEKVQEIFTTEGALTPMLNTLAEHVRKAAAMLDASTPKGREAIKSLAFKVGKVKNHVEETGVALNRKLKALPTAVDKNKAGYKAFLQNLQDETRSPVTRWETDQERQRTFISNIQVTPMQVQGAPQELLRETLAGLKALDLTQAPDFAQEATQAQETAIQEVESMLAARVQADADAAELARLRQEKEERDRKEAEEHRVREAAEQARREAEAKAQREKDEAERKAREAQEAAARAEQARKDAEAAAEKAKAEAEAKAQAAVEAERQRQAEAERKAKADQEARERDQEHRRKFNQEALAEIVTAIRGADPNAHGLEGMAKAVLTAIAKGLIPHVQIHY
ncbi:hypothetical protein [Mesoterricola sediminis]|uniref:TolA protein n=1 Tax=Mesoterricola sediminis TaxID=2927980 RepID=A0AA48GRH1_9BACT|nr:hypothetical protein [Mesoterricola sediminis]BDU76254.1 hypothetical protein METESE_12120 [Mesoterricola sediminis]